MKCSITLVSMACMTFLSCSNPNANTSGLHIIDATSEDKVSLSDIFETHHIIPLETTDESLIGVDICKIEQYQNKLFILNQLNSRRNILCFDSVGHYLFSIDHMGNGPQEYTYLSDFILDPAVEIITVCSEQGVYVQYDFEGNFVNKFHIDQPYYSRQIVAKDDSTYCAFNYGYGSDIPCDLLDIDSRLMKIRNQSAAKNNCSFESERPLSVLNGKIMYCDMNDTIYDVTNIEDRQPRYVVNFGESQSRIKQKLMKEHASGGDEFLHNYMKQYFKGELHFIMNIYQTTNWIGLSSMHNTSKQNKAHQSMILYNKNTNKTYVSDNIGFEEIGLDNILDIHLKGSDHDKLICVIYDALTDVQRSEMIDKSPFAPSSYDLFRKQNDNFSNPLILIVK